MGRPPHRYPPKASLHNHLCDRGHSNLPVGRKQPRQRHRHKRSVSWQIVHFKKLIKKEKNDENNNCQKKSKKKERPLSSPKASLRFHFHHQLSESMYNSDQTQKKVPKYWPPQGHHIYIHLVDSTIIWVRKSEWPRNVQVVTTSNNDIIAVASSFYDYKTNNTISINWCFFIVSLLLLLFLLVHVEALLLRKNWY